jgi:GNAT superfamily N-acetyltransferase
VGVLRDVFRRSALSNDGDREHLLSNPDSIEFSPASVNDGRTRVAVIDNHIVGFATTRTVLDAIELDDLFVDPDWMKRGVARALLQDVVAIAQTRGVRRLEVTANQHALGFYEKTGFVFDHDVETQFRTAPRMYLAIAP